VVVLEMIVSLVVVDMTASMVALVLIRQIIRVQQLGLVLI